MNLPWEECIKVWEKLYFCPEGMHFLFGFWAILEICTLAFSEINKKINIYLSWLGVQFEAVASSLIAYFSIKTRNRVKPLAPSTFCFMKCNCKL